MSASSITALLVVTLASPASPGPAFVHTLAPAGVSQDVEGGDAGATHSAAPQAEVDPNAELIAAQAARRADPSVANWQHEAELLEAKGERGAAMAAYAEARARAADSETVATLDAKVAALDAQPDAELPGTQVVEGAQPASELTEGPEQGGEDPATLFVVDVDVQREPITKQWYFWVTVVAITASAGAITAIAAKAAIDERKATRSGSLPAPIGGAPGPGPALLRF